MDLKIVKSAFLVLFFSLSTISAISAQETGKSSPAVSSKASSSYSDGILTELLKRAEKGDAKAQFLLSEIYKLGKSVGKDDAEAMKWCRKAAVQGHAEAQYSLGRMYYHGWGVQADLAEAVKWFRKSAEQGNASAQSNLGLMYKIGLGVQKDDAEAVKWYRKAAEQGDASAQYKLGLMYFNGQGAPKDYAKAVKWYRKAAEQGNASAQVNLGMMYLNDQNVPKDYAAAVKWFRKAAEQGIAEAQSNLGAMHYLGQGVKKDYAEAIKWFRKAAEQGYAGAMFNLGAAYFNGSGVLQSKHVAADWFYKAGTAYLKEGNKEKALEAVDNIEKVVPGHFLAKNLTGRIYGGKPQGDRRRPADAKYFGTAWPVASGYAVTNNHVIGERYKITLVRTDGVRIPAVIAIRDKINDIVLLKPVDPNTALPPALPISSNTPRIGAEVFTVGYPLLNLMGISPKLVSGHVNALTGIMDDPRTLQISVPIQSGNSGGPLLNMKGEVVGIVTSKLNAAEVFKWTGDLPQNVNYAIKANYIKSLVDSVPPRKNRAGILPSKSGSLEDVADRVKNSVMIIVAE